MADSKADKEFNPWQSYMMIGAGVCLLAIRFMGAIGAWSVVDMLKVGIGAALIVYGIVKLVRKK